MEKNLWRELLPVGGIPVRFSLLAVHIGRWSDRFGYTRLAWPPPTENSDD